MGFSSLETGRSPADRNGSYGTVYRTTPRHRPTHSNSLRHRATGQLLAVRYHTPDSRVAPHCYRRMLQGSVAGSESERVRAQTQKRIKETSTAADVFHRDNLLCGGVGCKRRSFIAPRRSRSCCNQALALIDPRRRGWGVVGEMGCLPNYKLRVDPPSLIRVSDQLCPQVASGCGIHPLNARTPLFRQRNSSRFRKTERLFFVSRKYKLMYGSTLGSPADPISLT